MTTGRINQVSQLTTPSICMREKKNPPHTHTPVSCTSQKLDSHKLQACNVSQDDATFPSSVTAKAPSYIGEITHSSSPRNLHQETGSSVHTFIHSQAPHVPNSNLPTRTTLHNQLWYPHTPTAVRSIASRIVSIGDSNWQMPTKY